MRKILYKIITRFFSRSGVEKVRHPAIKVPREFITSHLKLTFAEIDGHKMFLDSKDSLGLSINGVYEPLGTKLAKREIQKGDVVLDIGANIGYYTLIFAKLVGEDGKVFAFEPEPNNFALLKKNVETNGYRNVVLIQKAVSNKNGRIKLYLSENNKANHRIYDSHDGRLYIEIDAIRLDDYFKDRNEKIDFIKIDIEGAEGGAIQGMTSLLKKNKTVKIITEFWAWGLERFGTDPKEYLELLVKQGFKLYYINEQEEKIKRIPIAELLERYAPEKGNYTNLLCVRTAPVAQR